MSTVTIVGGGLDFSAHPSAEACRALRNAKVVLHAGCHPDVADWIANLARQARVADIDVGYYQIGQYRPDMYRAMAAAVVQAAVGEGDTVLIEPGSAMVTDLVTPFVLDAAARAGVRTRVIPGVSCLEHIFIAFGVDPSAGLQVVLAQELVARRLPLSPRFDTVIIQPGYYDTLWCVGWPRSRADRFEALVETMAASLPRRQPMALVRFPMHPDDTCHTFWFALEDLPRLADVLTPLHSLFVPAAEPGGRDASFQRRMQLWDSSIALLERDPQGEILQLPPTPTNADVAARAAALPADLRRTDADLARAWSDQRMRRTFERLEGAPEAAPA